MSLANEKKELLEWLEDNQSKFIEISDQIWANPEIMWEEFFASGLQADFLEQEGFSVTRDVAGMKTAFIAEYGKGKPIIAMIGEYDALPGLSQKAQSTKEAVEKGGHGHGCGHNMLGTASVAAAVAVKQWLQNKNTSGTVRYYGCPAEEGGGGKVFMARDGLFDDLDCALTYQPDDMNSTTSGSTVAIQFSSFLFTGVSSHAGMTPHLGRSALDAVELMNVAANYLREHVLDGTRIQYIITDGGQAANIVPETAEVEYILRAGTADYLKEVADRLRNIAKGAALMTGAKFQENVKIAYSSLVPNHVLSDLMYAALEFIGPIEFSENEIVFAQIINDSFLGTNDEYIQRKIDYYKPSADIESMLMSHIDTPLIGANIPTMDKGMVHGGASDVGDLSQVAPTGFLGTTCHTTGTPGPMLPPEVCRSAIRV
ncbi:MAG: amidohydrolase [Anaerolineales bacterium]